MHHISKVSFKIIFVSLRCVFVNNKCSEVAAEICSRLAIEMMLGNSMGDIFFSQSVFERLCVCVWGFFPLCSRRSTFWIQVMLFRYNSTIKNFLQYSAICFSRLLSLLSSNELSIHYLLVL